MSGSRNALRRSRAVLWPLLAAALAACQSGGLSEPRPAADAGWRVVERTGEVRLHGEGTGAWTPVMAGGEVDGSSRVTTGPGGRLILAGGGVQISAGTASAFVLGDPDARPLRQDAGRLRYRVEREAKAPFVIETPFMRIRTQSAVFDVAVRPDGGEVAVEKGRLLVMTSDGARGATLQAGQIAYSRTAENEPLMVRHGAEEAAVAADPQAAVAPRTAAAAVHAIARARLEPEPASRPAATSPTVPPMLADEAPEPAILPAGYRENGPPPVPATAPAAPKAPALPEGDDAEALPAPKPEAATGHGRGEGIARLTEGLVQAIKTAPMSVSSRPARPAL
jgi:ferric-dicitrate binding protein FerR (iron transport regulator)